MNIKIFSLLSIFWWCALGGVPIQFERITECMLESSKGCIKWKSQLFFYAKQAQHCVPGSMQIVTSQGTKLMQHLTLGDEILSYNPETHNLEYQPVIGWLHRNPRGMYEYLRIPIDSSFIIVSGKHNIAISSQNSTSPIYTFAERLHHDDRLLLFSRNSPSHHTTVNTQANQIVFGRGLYAPYVRGNMNYFILNEGMGKMVLLHCFANVNVNPFTFHSLTSVYEYLSLFDESMLMYWHLGLSEQPSNQSYIHPFVSLVTSMFGSVIDWSEEKYQVQRRQKGYVKLRSFQSKTFRQLSLAEEQPDFLRHDREMVLFLESFFSQRYLY